MTKKILLVTFPVDLGGAKFEKYFINLFEPSLDLRVHRFAPDEGMIPYAAGFIPAVERIGRRIVQGVALWKEVVKAQKEGRRVVFQGVSPALYAYPITQPNSSYIVTDWTRKLYESIRGVSMSPFILTIIHRMVLRKQKKILGLTDSVVQQIASDYGVPTNKIKKCKVPFSMDMDTFSPSECRQDDEVRILFVGGDFKRKGGDVLLDWFSRQRDPKVKLTMVTNSLPKKSTGAVLKKNVQYGHPEHKALYESHDIFVLPTKYDAFPCVIGEAACAGLALLTTENALGATEVIKNGINGFICASTEELIGRLEELIKNKALIESMKIESRKWMEKTFSREAVLLDYIENIF